MNTDLPSPGEQFSALLSRFPPEIVAMVGQCLPKLRRAFPGTYELVYDYADSLVVSIGVSDRGYEAIVALAIFPDRVRLYFDKSLPDPKHLLEGKGGKVRSLILKAASELDHGDVKDLIDAAITHSGASFPSAGAGGMVIKTKAKRRESTKPGE
jgi:hypothetical protein